MRPLCTAAALLALAGCGTDLPLDPVPAEIERVGVTPNPVAPLDTAVFQVFASRRVQQSSWNLSDGRSALKTGDTIMWTAPAATGSYRQLVALVEGSDVLDTREFFVEVSDD